MLFKSGVQVSGFESTNGFVLQHIEILNMLMLKLQYLFLYLLVLNYYSNSYFQRHFKSSFLQQLMIFEMTHE